MAGNSSLNAAARAKKDEFYTRLEDIEQELKHYRRHFKGKVVFCNCDDPFESNFFKYFVLNFNKLGLKKLIATCYRGSPIAGQQLSMFDEVTEQEEPASKPYKAVVTKVYDATGDGGISMLDVAELFRNGENELTLLEGDGDFRSPECLALLDEADIVCTNPPFSLFREYIALLVERKKHFLIIGNQNAVTYKEVFPLLMNNIIWWGVSDCIRWFIIPEYVDMIHKRDSNGEKIAEGARSRWWTNLDHKKRHEELVLIRRYSSDRYSQYDNYDAIEIPQTVDIPCDYSGLMGVPITFLDKYSPDQFEIIGITKTWFGAASKVYGIQIQVDKSGKRSTVTKLNDGPVLKVESPPDRKTYYEVDGGIYIQLYARIIIRNRHPEEPKQ